eukprot:m.5910 g.5910  ORF g.5910 m.5910 type:complete len:211 (+) comp2510_c0_seq2:30-662(+)
MSGGVVANNNDLRDLIRRETGMASLSTATTTALNNLPTHTPQSNATTATNATADTTTTTTTKKTKHSSFDEAKLLSTVNGIPYMYNTFKEHLKFHTKPGYESQNLRKLMDQYDVWMDQLVPNLSIPDVVRSIEKLGHKTSVKTYLQGMRYGLSVGDGEYDEEEEEGEEEEERLELNGEPVTKKAKQKKTAPPKPKTKRAGRVMLTGIASS